MNRKLTGLGMAILAVLAAPAMKTDVAHAAGNGTVALATAGFQVTFGGQTRTIEFTAQRDGANASRGQGHLFNHVTGTKLHLAIDCLQVVGNVATVSGTVSGSDSSVIEEGLPFWLRVVDNGEGGKAPADLTSSVLVFLTGAGTPCTASALEATLPIEGGNIQVH